MPRLEKSKGTVVKTVGITLATIITAGALAYGSFVVYAWFDIRFNTLLQALAYSIQVKCM